MLNVISGWVPTPRDVLSSPVRQSEQLRRLHPVEFAGKQARVSKYKISSDFLYAPFSSQIAINALPNLRWRISLHLYMYRISRTTVGRRICGVASFFVDFFFLKKGGIVLVSPDEKEECSSVQRHQDKCARVQW